MADGGRIAGANVIANLIEVDLVWTLASGKVVKNIMHAQLTGGGAVTVAIAQAIYASIIASAAWTAWAALLHSTTNFAGVYLRDLRVANQPYLLSTGAATPGTGAGSALPPGVSLCVTEKTAFAGRGWRGRIYLPCLDSAVLTAASGAFTGAASTAALNFVNQVGTSLTASGMTQALMQAPRQAYTGRKGRAIPLRLGAVQVVTSNVVRGNALVSQRRRSYVA